MTIYKATILLSVPDDAPATAADIRNEINGVLSVGADADETPALWSSAWSVAKVEKER